MNHRGRRALRRWLTVGVVALSVVVVALVVLIAEGVLVLPSTGPTPVTISSVSLHIREGTTSTGIPWLGPAYVNYTTANGYPIQVAPGGSWTVDWTFLNFDNHFHNITGVFPVAPFTLGGTQPKLPYTLIPGAEGCALSMTIVVPSSASGTYAVSVVVDAGMVS